MNNKIAIIGLGYVGLPLALAFGKKKNCIGYDLDKTRIKDLKIGLDKNKELIKTAKIVGFSDKQIANRIGSDEISVRKLRKKHNITPFVKQIDTLAAEFPAQTNYLYTTYNASSDDIEFDDNGNIKPNFLINGNIKSAKLNLLNNSILNWKINNKYFH